VSLLTSQRTWGHRYFDSCCLNLSHSQPANVAVNVSSLCRTTELSKTKFKYLVNFYGSSFNPAGRRSFCCNGRH
jgi:hypothetical protein